MSGLKPEELRLLPRGSQVHMQGQDWTSGREQNAQAKAEAARKKAATDCAKKLEAAADALQVFMSACNECNDATRVQREDDSRIILTRNIMEYANWLSSIYAK